jgi:ArsR family transcriptional regulator
MSAAPTSLASPEIAVGLSAIRATYGGLADILKELAEPVRLAILWHLSLSGPCNVTGLSYAVDMRQQAVTHHLTRLKLRGLVTYERRGKSNVYHLTERGRAALLRASA